MTSYALIQEFRFTNNTGSTLAETHVATQIFVFLHIFVQLALNYRNLHRKTENIRVEFIIEYFLEILPLILILTVLNDFLFIVQTGLIILILCVLFLKRNNLIVLPDRAKRILIKDDKLVCISNIRSVVNIISVISILSADFTCFPEKYLKTETSGYGLMDIGVGMYMVTYSITQSYFQRTRSFSYICKKLLPFVSLGIGRSICTSAVGYHHQVTEYGVQWNFFLTVFLLTLLNEFIFKFLVKSINHVIMLIMFLLFMHQSILLLGLEDWIVSDASRDNIFTSNREGLCSLPGFLILYLFGIVINYYLPKKGMTFHKYLHILKYYVLGFFVSTVVTKLAENTITVSRRTANTGFIFWIISITFLCLIMAFCIELAFRFVIFEDTSRVNLITPIMKSVNFNPLVFFLVGNLLTGLINLTFQTLTFNTFSGVLIISIYMFVNCSLAVFLEKKNLRLR